MNLLWWYIIGLLKGRKQGDTVNIVLDEAKNYVFTDENNDGNIVITEVNND